MSRFERQRRRYSEEGTILARPKMSLDQAAKSLGLPLGLDQTGSAIRIPQTGLAHGAGFGDTITDSDLEWAVEREPVAYRVTAMFAEDVLDKWFTIDDPRTEGKDPDLDRKVQAILRALDAKHYFIEALTGERSYGWSIIVGGFTDAKKPEDLAQPKPENTELKSLAVYPKPKVTSTDKEKNENDPRFGQVNYYYVDRGGARRLKVHYSRVIYVQTRDSGKSVLCPIWDDLTSLRNIRWGMGQTMFRYGGGFPIITLMGKSLEELQAYAESGLFADLMSRTYMFQNEYVKVEFKGLGGVSLNPTLYYSPIMENIAAGTGIPEAILRGVQAGALTGSETNLQEYFKVIGSNQSKLEKPIRQLVDWVLPQSKSTVKDYEIDFLAGFEPTEKDQAYTEYLVEQGQSLRLQYMTVDEVRAKVGGLEDLPNGEGKVVPGLMMKTPMPGFGFESDQVKEEPNLLKILRDIAVKIGKGELPLENGVAQGRRLISLFVAQQVEQATVYLSQRLKRPITVLPSELMAPYQDMAAEYERDFKALIGSVQELIASGGELE